MLYIAFLQNPDQKKKKKEREKKKIDLPTLPISGQKGKQTFFFLGLIVKIT